MLYLTSAQLFIIACLAIGGCSTAEHATHTTLLDDAFPSGPGLLSEAVNEEPILPLNLPPKATLISNPRAPQASEHPLSPYRTVYFPYDSWYLTTPNQHFLSETAEVIKRSPTPIAVLIEGHTDTRGTNSYNMVLSQRRANAIQSYLQDLGLPKEQLRIVSFGETHPSCSNQDEQCHRYNRRAFLVFSRQPIDTP